MLWHTKVVYDPNGLASPGFAFVMLSMKFFSISFSVFVFDQNRDLESDCIDERCIIFVLKPLVS